MIEDLKKWYKESRGTVDKTQVFATLYFKLTYSKELSEPKLLPEEEIWERRETITGYMIESTIAWNDSSELQIDGGKFPDIMKVSTFVKDARSFKFSLEASILDLFKCCLVRKTWNHISQMVQQKKEQVEKKA